jgi:hypothetical protein
MKSFGKSIGGRAEWLCPAGERLAERGPREVPGRQGGGEWQVAEKQGITSAIKQLDNVTLISYSDARTSLQANGVRAGTS